MSLRHSRLSRVLGCSVVPLLASTFFVACSGGTGESVGTTTQAESADGILHSHVTKDTWQPHVGENRGGWDDERRCHPRAFDLCPLFDSDFIGVDAGAACEHVTTTLCPDRVNTWDVTIVLDFALSLDCRFGLWAPPTLTDTDVANYLNDLLAFTLQFMGCPLEGTTSKLTFGLIPSALAGRQFTTADLDALADLYVAAVVQALSDNGSPPLTEDQVEAIDAKLMRLANHVPNRVHSRSFTFSNCAPGTVIPDPTPVDTDDDDCR